MNVAFKLDEGREVGRRGHRLGRRWRERGEREREVIRGNFDPRFRLSAAKRQGERIINRSDVGDKRAR